MLDNYLPVYENAGEPYFVTLDGRVGAILEFPSTVELFDAFSKTTQLYRFFHSQAIEIDGRKLLTISKYTLSIRDGFFSPLQRVNKAALVQSFVECSNLIHEFKELTHGTYITVYPKLPDLEAKHLYKLKYSLDWAADSSKFGAVDGYCMLHFPNLSNVKVMYLSSMPLKDLLESGILCVEFVGEYKATAFNFWTPLGATEYFAELFKL